MCSPGVTSGGPTANRSFETAGLAGVLGVAVGAVPQANERTLNSAAARNTNEA